MFHDRGTLEICYSSVSPEDRVRVKSDPLLSEITLLTICKNLTEDPIKYVYIFHRSSILLYIIILVIK